MKMFTRTCQECGYKWRRSTEPSQERKASAAYGHIACKRCGSEAYDYGSWQEDDGQQVSTEDWRS